MDVVMISRSLELGAKARRAAWLLVCVVLLLQFQMVPTVSCDEVTSIIQPVSSQEMPLPTPRSHYETFKSGVSGILLLQELVKDLDPESQKAVLTFVALSGLLNSSSTTDLNSPEAIALLKMAEAMGINKESRLPKPQVLALLKQMNWTPWRPLLLEFIVHQSQVIDMIPDKYQSFWYPIVHDALLYFLDHLPQDRLLEKLVDIAYLPPGSTRSDELTAFVSKTPSLQKVGQILARNPALSPDYRAALQLLENGIHTMDRDSPFSSLRKTSVRPTSTNIK